MPFDRERLTAAAESVEIDLSEEDIERYRDAVSDAEERVKRLSPDVPDAQAPDDIAEGDDPYNAFRYQFTGAAGTGALQDLRVAVKDNMAVAGVPMTCGSAAGSFTPQYDATVVTRLRSAGAELVGTTNMDEFALFTTGETCIHGATENPAVEGRVPGGSSSGSGAAVGGGLVDASLGSDTGGSIRIPASFCGLVGLKPTHRTVPRFGFADLSPTLDHIGPLARDVDTAFRVYEAIAGPDPNDPSSLVARPSEGSTKAATNPAADMSIGVVSESLDLAEDDVEANVRVTTDRLADSGLEVESVSLPMLADIPDVVVSISGPEFTALFENDGCVFGTGTGYSDQWRQAVASMDRNRLGDGPRDTLILNRLLLDQTGGQMYIGAQNARRSWIKSVSELLEEFDAIVTPTTPMTAPPFGEIQGISGLLETIALTSPFNLTGHPALSIPSGTIEGRPVGYQIVADWYGEPTLAELGALVERAA